MSRDQKPKKMRVIAGGGQAPQPLRHAEDQGPEIAPAGAADEAPRGRLRLLSLIYVACCAVGGVGVVLLMRSFAS